MSVSHQSQKCVTTILGNLFCVTDVVSPQKSILSHVTTLTFVVTCDYIDFFLANVTVNHNVHTFTIIVHTWLFVPQFSY